MAISLVDAFIVLFLLMGAIVGFKHGVIREITQFLGLFIIIVIAFMYKDKLMVLFYENLPFFDFFGKIKGLGAINILFYQLVSFLVIFIALLFVLKVLIVITGFVELMLKMTVFLSLPSKLLGMIVGVVEFYVYLFIALYVLNMPVFNLTFVSESKFGNSILENTPILSHLVDDTVQVYSDVWSIIKNRDEHSNKEINTFVLASLLDHHLISVDSAKKLVSTNKIIIDDEGMLDQYQEGESLFEKLGGCLLVDRCLGNAKTSVGDFFVHGVGSEFTRDNLSFRVTSLSNEPCLSSLGVECDDDAKIEVGLEANVSGEKRNYVITTKSGYRLISGTEFYLYADIVDGELVIGLAQ